MINSKNILVTGGLGFIGRSLIKKLLFSTNHKIFNLDFNGYASDKESLKNIVHENSNFRDRYTYFNLDISNFSDLNKIFKKIQPDLIFNLAAESHVDRSIDNPDQFIKSNIIGTFNLLELSKIFYSSLDSKKKEFRFIHISTDEVFGSLGELGLFNEKSSYDPRSPYSATKASSDHLVNAWFHTYGLPTIICNCSNNFGPGQFPEKLIPNIILKALNNENIPIYGDGKNIRDWLFIDDHVDALILISKKGKPGSNYCIGGNNEKTNIELANMICDYLDKIKPTSEKYSDLITFVEDRPGHDRRYAIDSSKIKNELHWHALVPFDIGIKKTIEWYEKNIDWCIRMQSKAKYKGQRLGLKD